MKIDQFLQQSKAFCFLTRNEFQELCKNTQEMAFKKGKVVFKEGEPSHSVWLVKTGWVHLIRRTCEGNPMILFTMTPHEILCGVSAFDQEPYAADGVTATECILLQITSELFVKFLNENSRFCREILSICSGRIRKMAQKLGGVTDPVSHRLARLIMESMDDFGYQIPFTHREIAQMIGARTETSIRTIRGLREQGLLSIKRSCIEISQPLQLLKELKEWLKPSVK